MKQSRPAGKAARAAGGVASVDRALSILSAFTETSGPLSLGELAAATGLYKSTVLRLLASLQAGGYVARGADGAYSLGPEIARLQRVFQGSFALDSIVLPALRNLVQSTKESAAFYVRKGDQRMCLFRVDSPQVVRDHAEVGDLLPLDRGSPGQVLLAFSGEQGPIYDEIRRRKAIALFGDRVPDVAGVAAPVFGAGNKLLGALCLSMPTVRLSPELARTYEQLVLDQARTVTLAAGGSASALEPEVSEASVNLPGRPQNHQ